MDILPDIKRKIMGWRNRFWALCVPSSTEATEPKTEYRVKATQ
jgi:hypothetical protein